MQTPNSNGDTVPGNVEVEFFGPFRAFGKGVAIPCESGLSYEDLVSALGELLGEEFRAKAERKTTTLIVNNRIVAGDKKKTIRVVAGDRVAFALLLGGG